ncbi:DUF1990 family protein [Glycomyces xiaoerkulensis]|uniref:DUF1990 family protein n=1 Tax=Glycomyces xiaoerkulensis TaxID=2038139 RepID=UPI0018E43068|nr:DUF1990 domain-containing protein [Glycomyces xiaoerkulensis]
MNYPEVGRSASGTLPSGYRHLRESAVITSPLAEAADFLLGWHLHRAMGLKPRADAARAEPGAAVTLHFAGLAAPCRVVWAVRNPQRAGFAYGSTDGHPECGEACFMLERIDDRRTRFSVTSFSRPGRWYTRLGAPVARVLQARATRHFVDRMALRFQVGTDAAAS